MFQSTRPRGARPRRPVSLSVQTCFNPRARAGRDRAASFIVLALCCFNPRARAGRDMHLYPSVWIPSGFNPRARAGRDIRRETILSKGIPFQSTRPRGARPRRVWSCLSCRGVSIHAPARGATEEAPVRHSREGVSIHAPARGATSILVTEMREKEFQSTRPRGARRTR